MRGSVWAVGAIGAAGAALQACHAIAGLEPPRDVEDAAVVEAAVVDAGPGTWCERDRREADEAIAKDAGRRGRQLFCADFESPATFEKERPDMSGTISFVDDTEHSESPRHSLKVVVRTNPDVKAVALRSHTEGLPADKLEFAFDFSFGTTAAYPVDATATAITLAVLQFGSAQLIAIGVIENQLAIAFVDDLQTITVSEIARRGQRFVGVLNPQRAFQRIFVRIARGMPKGCDTVGAQYIGPDAGVPGDLYVLTYDDFSDAPRKCAQLPGLGDGGPSDIGESTTLAIGGFLQEPKIDYEWRFDNVTVHMVP